MSEHWKWHDLCEKVIADTGISHSDLARVIVAAGLAARDGAVPLHATWPVMGLMETVFAALHITGPDGEARFNEYVRKLRNEGVVTQGGDE